ncbi:MAG: hypothetical protein KQ78_01510 [Candidatus Izimaplasma bacterium HR2]|nr:MAG: hypothetical protein KQ78_01510 [Candidatus Izimaplasma bacterium HR2]
MDTVIRLSLMIVIGGFIGWITNKVAIKLLFRPVNPVKILFFRFQGVFPKRKDQMAISLADTIENELLSKEVIFNKILNEENLENIKANLKETLKKKITEIIPSMVRMFMGDVDKMVSSFIDKDGDKLFDEMIDEFQKTGLEKLNIREIVKERIDELDFIEFEKIIFGLMSKELKHIEIIGLFLGALIGILQFLIVTFI